MITPHPADGPSVERPDELLQTLAARYLPSTVMSERFQALAYTVREEGVLTQRSLNRVLSSLEDMVNLLKRLERTWERSDTDIILSRLNTLIAERKTKRSNAERRPRRKRLHRRAPMKGSGKPKKMPFNKGQQGAAPGGTPTKSPKSKSASGGKGRGSKGRGA